MSPVHFSAEVTLGNLAIVVTLIGIAVRFGFRVGMMENRLNEHAKTMIRHTERLDKYEERLVDITGHVQRLIGRLEATQDRIEKMTGFRQGEQGRR